MRLLRDYRVWIGFAVTGLCLWLALRNVDLAAVGEALRTADWRLILFIAVPSNLVAVYIRAHRWRCLTDPIQPIAVPSLFKAVGIGFMANNLLPLRMGEFIRAWALSRESGGNVTKLFGTVVFERVIDMGVFVLLIFAVLSLHDYGGDNRVSPEQIATLFTVAIVGIIVLRLRPNWVVGIFRFLLRPLPTVIRDKLDFLLRELIEGLISVRGARPWLWIGLHSILIWCVTCTIPFVVGIVSVGIPFDSIWILILMAFATQVAVGFFIAAPSAPGFFGTYHLACQFALASFGVPIEQGLAAGVVIHLSFWFPVTVLGLIQFLSLHQTLSLVEVSSVVQTGKDQPE